MKMIKNRIIWFVTVALMGIVILIFNVIKGNTDSSIIGLSSGMIAVAVVKIVQLINISKNKDKLKKYEVMQNEERYIMISQMSGKFTLYITIWCEFLASFILILCNNNQIAIIIMYVAAIQSFAYLLIFKYLEKKY